MAPMKTFTHYHNILNGKIYIRKGKFSESTNDDAESDFSSNETNFSTNSSEFENNAAATASFNQFEQQ